MFWFLIYFLLLTHSDVFVCCCLPIVCPSALCLLVLSLTQFETADPTLPPASQASLTLEPVAYHSPNQRYLYIDVPMFGRSLSTGKYTNIHVYSATPSYLRIKSLNYLVRRWCWTLLFVPCTWLQTHPLSLSLSQVLSKGKVVYFSSMDFVDTSDGKQTLNFLVTKDMVPSIRLLVYYVLHGEGTTELVADSVWMDVRDNCLSGLQVKPP